MWKIQASESVAKQGRGGWIEKPDVELQGKLAAGSYCWICCRKAHNRQDLPQRRMPVMSLRSGGCDPNKRWRYCGRSICFIRWASDFKSVEIGKF